jgi:peptidoglycan/xylan/chitin deacetylase (PgdA/CDA1 family)
MSARKRIPLPSAMLTFDDGYLDNWVYVYPILKKYNAKATIFVNPEFVDPSNEARPNLEDLWANTVTEEQLSVAGFLNWQEMRRMQESKLVDIQSHGLTHTWYFSSPRLIAFHKPGHNEYPWMAWNLRPDKKPFYLTEDQSEYVHYGTPIYVHEKALICRRYFPPREVAYELTSFVARNGGIEFFNLQGSEKQLLEYHHLLMTKFKIKEYYETDEEHKRRLFNELKLSKQLIEQNLDKNVDFICWPGGAYNKQVLSLAEEAGYKAWTLSSSDQTSYKNIQGGNPKTIKRVGSAPLQKYKDKTLGYTSGSELLFALKTHQGSLFYKYAGWYKKLKRLTTSLR